MHCGLPSGDFCAGRDAVLVTLSQVEANDASVLKGEQGGKSEGAARGLTFWSYLNKLAA